MLAASNWISAREPSPVSRRSVEVKGAFSAAATASPESPRRTDTTPLMMLMRATARFGVSAVLSLGSPPEGGAGAVVCPHAIPSISTDAKNPLFTPFAFTALCVALGPPNDNSLILGQFPLS